MSKITPLPGKSVASGPSGPAAPAPAKLELHNRIEAILHSTGYTPDALIDALKSDSELGKLLQQPAVREGYSIEEHTLMVLRQFEKYFGDIDLPPGITRAEMRLMLALHDIGKGIGADRSEQYDHTMRVIETLRNEGLFSVDTFKLITAPLTLDSLGKYFYRGVQNGPGPEDKLIFAEKIAAGAASRQDFEDFAAGILLVPAGNLQSLAETSAAEIRNMATNAGLSVRDLLSILTIYYQCDTLAYTYDASRDRHRSTVLTSETVGNIKFNHDRALTAKTGLLAKPGERSWEYYARLEMQARAGAPRTFPLTRGYPSLDFLYKMAENFDPTDTKIEPRMFVVDRGKKRLCFIEPFGKAFALLEGLL